MYKACGALVLGLLVLGSSAASAQCRNNNVLTNGAYGVQSYGVQSYGAQSGAYYDARTGGRYVNPNQTVYNNNNNVAVYQQQLNQAAQVNAYSQYNNGYANNGYANNAYGNAYNNQVSYQGYNQVTVTPNQAYGYNVNQPGYVQVNPWNGQATNTYNGYSYNNAVAGQQVRGNNCLPRRHHGNMNSVYNRFWVNR